MAFGDKTNERPGTRAVVRNSHVSAYKAREVLDLIRNQPYGRASEILEFTERAVAEVIRKCLDSAVANAEHNDDIPAEELFVSACFADEGPTMKRFRPRARGSASRIRKRTCHITVIVSRYSPAQLADLRQREVQAGRAGSRTGGAASEARRRRVAASRELAAVRAAEEEAHDHDHDGHDHDGQPHDHEGHAHAHDRGDDEVAASTADDAATAAEAAVVEGPHGPGSAMPFADGSGPDSHPIKGNDQSMLYHVPGSRYFKATKAEMYFATVEDAERAGYAAPGAGHDDAPAVIEGPSGPGSAMPLADGSGPAGYEIKGNDQSMLYHVPGGRYYKATKAEMYFATVEDAERAGYAAPGAHDSEEEGE